LRLRRIIKETLHKEASKDLAACRGHTAARPGLRRSAGQLPSSPPKQDNPNHIFSIGDGFGFCFIINDFQSSRKHGKCKPK